MNNREHNWVCYDAECALCVRWVERFRVLLEKYGFALLPLQSLEVRAALKIHPRMRRPAFDNPRVVPPSFPCGFSFPCAPRPRLQHQHAIAVPRLRLRQHA